MDSILYRILEITNSQLHASKGGVYKVIEALFYQNIEYDSIYTFTMTYINYLMYEQFSPENRFYNKIEQITFGIHKLVPYKQFREGMLYIVAAI